MSIVVPAEAKRSRNSQDRPDQDSNAALCARSQSGICCAFLYKGTMMCSGARIGETGPSPYCKDHDFNGRKGRLTAQQWTQQILFVKAQRIDGYCLAWLNNGDALCPEQQVAHSPYCKTHDHNSPKGAPVFWW
jgi:hypothetical protein